MSYHSMNFKIVILLVLLFSTSTINVINFHSVYGTDNSNIIYVNNDIGNDQNPGFEIHKPKKTIRSAIDSVANGGTVVIASGHYKGLGNHNIILNKNVHIQGQNKFRTVIDGELKNRIFKIPINKKVSIYNLTMENGGLKKGYPTMGLAIRSEGICNVDNCILTNNVGTKEGGGSICCLSGKLTIKNCLFKENYGVSSKGGGHDIHNKGECIIKKSTFINSQKANIAITNSGKLIIDKCKFFDSRTGTSGICNSGKCILINSLFAGNMEDVCIYNNHSLHVDLNNNNFDIINCNFINKSILNSWHSNLNVTGCNFICSSNRKDGIICNEHYSNCTLHFNRFVGNKSLNSTTIFSDNTSFANAMYNWWGTNKGPLKTNKGTVKDEGWLLLSLKTGKSEIKLDKALKLYIELYNDSNGGNHAHEKNKYPSIIPITLKSECGKIKNTSLKYGTLNISLKTDEIKPSEHFMVSVADEKNPTEQTEVIINIKKSGIMFYPTNLDLSNLGAVISMIAAPVTGTGDYRQLPQDISLSASIKENMQIMQVNIPHLVFNFIPVEFNYMLKNEGTIKEIVNSNLEIKSINTYNLKNSTNLMPGEKRHVDFSWTPGIFDMGPYNLNLKSEYGDYGTHHTTEDKTTIFVFPWHILVITGLTGYIIYKKRRNGF